MAPASIRREVLETAKRTGAIVRELATDQSEGIRRRVEERFVKEDTPPSRFMWERLADKIAIRDSDAWRWVDDFLNSTPVLMFFNMVDEPTVFEFRDGKQVFLVLRESYAFEFYLTNYATDYLLCFNHHDFLIASGSAADWLKQRMAAG